MVTPFQEQYMDILQNIESALVSVYRQHEDMSDYNADKAVEALIRLYRAEETGHPAPAPRFQPIDQAAYDQVKRVCEWRLGREKFLDEKGRAVNMDLRLLSLEEIIACLKKVQKSIRYWQKEGGRRGYFFFVERFLP
jgi:hypothetical protein